MQLRKHASLFAGAAALTMTSSVLAGNDNDQEARIRELEAQVAQLKTSQNQDWLTEARATQIRGIVQDVLADADMRSSMLQGGGGAGYDNGFTVFSADGNFKLTMNADIAAQFIYNDGQGSSSSEGGSLDSEMYGFQIARARLAFSGHVVDPSWQYYLRMDAAYGEDNGIFSSQSFELLEAYIRKEMGNGLNLTFGQFKLPYLTEFLTDASDQLAVDRSIVSYASSTGWSQGIMLSGGQDQWRWAGAFSDGARQNSTTWYNVDTDWALTGSFDYLINGTWDQFDDGFHSKPGSANGQMVHVALHAEQGDDDFGFDYDTFSATADIQIEGDGWSAFAALIYHDVDLTGGPSGLMDDYFGFVAQGEYFFDPTTAGFGRYEFLEGSGTDEDVSILTLGVNKFYGDNVRATVDLVYGLNEIDGSHDLLSVVSSEIWNAGLFFDPSGEDGQWALRTQLELTY